MAQMKQFEKEAKGQYLNSIITEDVIIQWSGFSMITASVMKELNKRMFLDHPEESKQNKHIVRNIQGAPK